jgi:hypothetical protein
VRLWATTGFRMCQLLVTTVVGDRPTYKHIQHVRPKVSS